MYKFVRSALFGLALVGLSTSASAAVLTLEYGSSTLHLREATVPGGLDGIAQTAALGFTIKLDTSLLPGGGVSGKTVSYYGTSGCIDTWCAFPDWLLSVDTSWVGFPGVYGNFDLTFDDGGIITAWRFDSDDDGNEYLTSGSYYGDYLGLSYNFGDEGQFFEEITYSSNVLGTWSYSVEDSPATPVPLPASFGLFLLGMGSLAGFRVLGTRKRTPS